MVNDEWTWTGNDIRGEGAGMISESLKINSTLTELNLCCVMKNSNKNLEEVRNVIMNINKKCKWWMSMNSQQY